MKKFYEWIASKIKFIIILIIVLGIAYIVFAILSKQTNSIGINLLL